MYKEGKAIIKYTGKSFLNPNAVLSRDISVAFVSAFAKRNTKILDSTAATGIRGIRYYLESPSKSVTFLEMNKGAFSSLKRNITYNKVKLKASNESIQEYANSTEVKFDIIDLDPFGGVSPYVHDLMKISKDGTILMITATDGAVLCGADFKACMKNYDARPMHNELCHEVGMRILIGYVARVAAQFNFGIEVLASFDYMHYMRIFVMLRHGANKVEGSIRKVGYVNYCSNCLNRGIEFSAIPYTNKCSICGSRVDISGKAWLGGISDRGTIYSMLEAMQKGSKMFDSKSIDMAMRLSKELDIPLYYSIPALTKKMKIGAVSPERLMEKLRKKGFLASRTHMENHAIKTTAGIKTLKSCILAVSKGI